MEMEMVFLTKDELRSIIREELLNVTPQDPIAPQRKFNLEEAAAYVSLPVPSFRMHQHKIGGIKIGRRWIFTKGELDSFLERNRRKTLAEIRENV